MYWELYRFSGWEVIFAQKYSGIFVYKYKYCFGYILCVLLLTPISPLFTSIIRYFTVKLQNDKITINRIDTQFTGIFRGAGNVT